MSTLHLPLSHSHRLLGYPPLFSVKIYSRFSFQAEVNFLGDLNHSNLVRLIGCCIEDDQRLLVYEFMPRGSLENHLFRSM